MIGLTTMANERDFQRAGIIVLFGMTCALCWVALSFAYGFIREVLRPYGLYLP